MTKKLFVSAFAVLFSSQLAMAAPATPDANGHFYIYSNKNASTDHYAPSGWMGDYGDLRLDDSSKDKPKSAPTCIKIMYSAKAAQGAGWTGIYWQNPPNNWGSKPGGYDLSAYKRLTFWARGAKGGEVLAEVKIGGITGDNGDSDSVSIGPITLTADWKQYTIDMTGKTFNHVIGGFAWSAKRDDNPQGFTIYFDDIRFES